MFPLFEQNTRPDSKTNRRTFKILGCDAPSWPSGLTTSIQQNYYDVGIFADAAKEPEATERSQQI